MQGQDLSYVKATKTKCKLRMAIIGPSGCGKTYTSLLLAKELGKNIALIDTERGSARKYSDIFNFHVLELDNYHPNNYIQAIDLAEKEGYDVLIIDSLSHAWNGTDGALALIDKAVVRMKTANNFAAWREITPLHNRMIDAILKSNLHVIVTMRSKTEFSVEKDEKGKTIIRKIGLQPIQRDGLEYEFDIVGDMDLSNTIVISKTRHSALQQSVIQKPGKELALTILKWLNSGEPVKKKTPSVNNKDDGTIIINNIKSILKELVSKNFITTKKLNEVGEKIKDPQTNLGLLRLFEKQLALLNRLDKIKDNISQQDRNNFYRKILSSNTQGLKDIESELKDLASSQNQFTGQYVRTGIPEKELSTSVP